MRKIKVLFQQAVEQRLLRCAPHLLKLQRPQFLQRSAHRPVVWHHGFGPFGRQQPVRHLLANRRQFNAMSKPGQSASRACRNRLPNACSTCFVSVQISRLWTSRAARRN